MRYLIFHQQIDDDLRILNCCKLFLYYSGRRLEKCQEMFLNSRELLKVFLFLNFRAQNHVVMAKSQNFYHIILSAILTLKNF